MRRPEQHVRIRRIHQKLLRQYLGFLEKGSVPCCYLRTLDKVHFLFRETAEIVSSPVQIQRAWPCSAAHLTSCERIMPSTSRLQLLFERMAGQPPGEREVPSRSGFTYDEICE